MSYCRICIIAEHILQSSYRVAEDIVDNRYSCFQNCFVNNRCRCFHLDRTGCWGWRGRREQRIPICSCSPTAVFCVCFFIPQSKLSRVNI